MAEAAEKTRHYESLYTEEYFSGKRSFFYRLTGGYRDLAAVFDGYAGDVRRHASGGRLLDIGCAYGPFLRAAAESGLEVAGVDVSEAAVNYVRSELGLDAVVDSALTLDCEAAFGRTRFDAGALWYVIEHFPDLSPLLTRLADWVRPGGILAIATPCLDGVSGRRNADIFFERSPRDHFSIWSRRSARRLLGEFGFRVVKLVSTGHHPERYPSVRRGCLPRSLAMAHSRVMGWGDTFEIYARRSDSG